MDESTSWEDDGMLDDLQEEVPPPVMRAMGGWLFARGALGFVFGMATIFWPREVLANVTQLTLGVETADLLILSYLVIQAILLLFHALALGRAGVQPSQVRTAILGQAVVVVPAVIFLVIAESAPQVRAAVCIWAVLHGSLELWLYQQLRSTAMASDHLLAAVSHMLLGILLGFGDDMGPLTIVGFTGAAVLISGVLYMLGGYTRVSRARAQLRAQAQQET